MVVVISFAIGRDYRQELKGLEESLKKNSPATGFIIGTGFPAEDEMTFHSRFCGERRVSKRAIPVQPYLLNNWNNIGLLKPWFISECLKDLHCGYSDEVVIWLDADARVMRPLDDINDQLGDHMLGMVERADHFINGTIAMKPYRSVMDFVDTWWKLSHTWMKPQHDSWQCNDQHSMRTIIESGPCPAILDLGERWAALPPPLEGEKTNPVFSKPECANAYIWHWQMSRKVVKGWKNWPPPEDQRA